MNTPIRLGKNAIVDATAEVRFKSSVPPDTIVGLVYGALKDEFGAPEPLPLLQVPAQLREVDENLRYQPLHRFRISGHVLQLGPRTVSLSTLPYVNWQSAEPRLVHILTKLKEVSLFERVERVGLRYVNFFEAINVVEHSTLRVEIAGESISKHNLHLRTESSEGGITTIRQIISESVMQGPPVRRGSVIDLDVVSTDIPDGPVPVAALMAVFAAANARADDAFFGLLTPEFIDRFEPEY